MSDPKLLGAAADRFPELRQLCGKHGGGSFTHPSDHPASCACHGRGWTPKEPHLEDVLAMIIPRLRSEQTRWLLEKVWNAAETGDAKKVMTAALQAALATKEA